MVKIKGNWIKGKSPYPQGRPRGQNSLSAFYQDLETFSWRHLRWDKFCWQYILLAGRGAKAARNAGYSYKSARFIASRLLRKPVIQAMLQRCSAMVYLYERTHDMEYSSTGDVVKKKRQMEAQLRNLGQYRKV